MNETREAISTALDRTAATFEQLRSTADLEAIDRAATMMQEARMVVTSGSGSSGFVAAKFAHSLRCVEKPAAFLSPAEAIHGGLGVVQEGDVVLVISRGGQTAELLPIIDVSARKGARLVGITANHASVLAEASECVITMPDIVESDPLQVMATTSNLVTGALLDAVLASLMVRTRYTLEQFAFIHPGGAVGARLNSKD